MTTRVGFIGLGAVGKPMSMNIAKAGFDLMVYDSRQEPVAALSAVGAKVARSPAEAARHGEIIQLWVDDDVAVEETVLGEEGVLAGAQTGAVIVIHTAVQPATVRKVASHAGPKGVGVIDAQTSSGALGAASGSLTFLVGGEKDLLERCRQVFETSGKDIYHLGPLGMGAVAKCAQQAITCGTIMAVADGMRLAAAGGIAPETLVQVLQSSSAQGRVLDTWMDQFDSLSERRAGVYHKALRPAMGLAGEMGVPAPAVALAQQVIPLIPKLKMVASK